jgi:hypothetical protein
MNNHPSVRHASVEALESRQLLSGIDPAFGGYVGVEGPKGIASRGLVVLQDGGVIVTGHDPADKTLRMARYAPDGKADAAFGPVAVPGVGSDGSRLGYQPKRKRLVVLDAETWSTRAFTTAGAIDAAFAPPKRLVAGAETRAWSMLVQPDGRIRTGGSSWSGTAATGSR